MSRKQDPVLAVLRYFREADVPLAQQALAMATSIVRERSPKRKNDSPVRKHPQSPVRLPAQKADPAAQPGSSAD